MPIGARDLSTLVSLPAGWDGAALASFRLEDDTPFSAVVAQMQAAIGALNAELYNDPVWAGAVSYTDQPETEYRQGTSNGMERHTEYGRPDAARGDTTGHMLPLIGWDRRLGWTWDYLRKARMTQVQADVADAIKDVRDRFRLQVLTRILKRTDDSGKNNGLGTAGYSAGFATAAASTNVDFTPPSFGGSVFTSDHEHYVGISGGAFTAAVFTSAKATLLEHGHEPPFEFWIGTSDEATVRGLTGFVAAPAMNVTYGASTNVATLNPLQNATGGYYIGMLEDFAVRVVRGVPQYYGFGFKSYGPNSQRNPLRIRLPKGMIRPTVLAFADPNAGSPIFPLQNMMLFLEFGVGVGDRTAGTPRYTNSATWADGTPT